MRIYRMTATFGKLEHATLELEPGLNILHAPNEWGKTTWCAFLSAMLYGLDTRAKSTKDRLADKERYQPWSGIPMSGRIDLNWQGRDITIERKTKGRTPLGDFRAYETESGLPVPELTAAGCGQMLLGVEQSVFHRSGFIRLADLPVTQDEALRRRLNELVTTGDESGDAERLEKGLRELKNKCRYNRSGLLPQAEGRLRELETTAGQRQDLQAQCQTLSQRLGEATVWHQALENHRAALQYAAAQADLQRVEQARESRDVAAAQLAQMEEKCANHPSRESCEEKLNALQAFQAQWSEAQQQARLLPPAPEAPPAPAPFQGLSGEEAAAMADRDGADYQALSKKTGLIPCLILGILGFAAAGWMLFSRLWPVGLIVLGLSFVPSLLYGGSRKKKQQQIQALETKYGSSAPRLWREAALAYGAALQEYTRQKLEYQRTHRDLDIRLAELEVTRQSLCGQQTPEAVIPVWQDILRQLDQLESLRRDARRWEEHLQALQAMAKPLPEPAGEDPLTYPAPETERLLAETLAEEQRLKTRLDQATGRLNTFPDVHTLESEISRTREQIRRLEDTYAALTLAQDTLSRAKQDLQRRFAPRISQRAQELLGQMTGGRYERLSLNQDFTLLCGAAGEDTLHEALWRSSGTIDQLYLSLRLAVAEVLTPEAPLILDDALVRFDDERMHSAMEILQEMSRKKQILLFSCQQRETACLLEAPQ